MQLRQRYRIYKIKQRKNEREMGKDDEVNG